MPSADAGPDQHAPPPLPDAYASAGAGGRPLHLAAHALPDLGAHRRRDGVRGRPHRARRAGVGCSTVFDHHYVFPRGVSGLVEAELAAARELGVRMVASRGSMDLGASLGGLPPDELAEDLDATPRRHRAARRARRRRHGRPRRRALLALSPSPRLMEESVLLAGGSGFRLPAHLAETREEEAYCRGLSAARLVRRPRAWAGSTEYLVRTLVHPSREEVAASPRPASRGRLPHLEPAPRRRHRARRDVDAGARVGLGVDGSASNERSDMCFEVKQALLAARAWGRHRDDGARRAPARHPRQRRRAQPHRHRLARASAPTRDLADGLELGGARGLPAALVLSAAPRRLPVGGREVVRDGALANADAAEDVAREHRVQAACCGVWRSGEVVYRHRVARRALSSGSRCVSEGRARRRSSGSSPAEPRSRGRHSPTAPTCARCR